MHTYADFDIIRLTECESRSDVCGVPRHDLTDWDCQVSSVNHIKRLRIPLAQRKSILAIQENRCLYCGHEFGTLIERRGQIESVDLQWDHFFPVLYTGDHLEVVAACRVYNHIKADRVFETVEDATRFICKKRRSKGYDMVVCE